MDSRDRERAQRAAEKSFVNKIKAVAATAVTDAWVFEFEELGRQLPVEMPISEVANIIDACMVAGLYQLYGGTFHSDGATPERLRGTYGTMAFKDWPKDDLYVQAGRQLGRR